MIGLSAKPFISTKIIIKPVILRLIEQGLVSVVYSDDIFYFGNDYQSCLLNIETKINMLPTEKR